MMFRRVVEALRAQDWTAIAIELVIVILGVFIGTQVSNWNEQRIEKRETERLVQQLQPELHGLIDFASGARTYYATTHDYAEVAFRGWEQAKSITDEQFVIAAYQASQIYAFSTSGENWAEIFGADRLRKIDDPEIRSGLATMMKIDFDIYDFTTVDTPYRRNVRRVIPDPVQRLIRERCGDRSSPNKPQITTLPKRCQLGLPVNEASSIAARLRARPELADDLRWHLAAVAAFLSNLDTLDGQTRNLSSQIDITD